MIKKGTVSLTFIDINSLGYYNIFCSMIQLEMRGHSVIFELLTEMNEYCSHWN
jgi:hypothetical protein